MAEEKKRLLIADDSFIDREILHHILENYFEITDAKNGYEALDILTKKEVKFDAMLLDVVMPLIDGFSVFQFHRDTRNGQSPSYFRAYGNDFMSFNIIQNLLIAVVTAVIFAIMPQQACTDCNFHNISP